MVFETLWLSQGCTHSSGRLPASIQFLLVSLTLRSCSTGRQSRLVSESGLACTQKVSTTSVSVRVPDRLLDRLGILRAEEIDEQLVLVPCARRK
jgi:hypothetical protein